MPARSHAARAKTRVRNSRFPPRGAKAVARRGFHNDRAVEIVVITSKLAESKAKLEGYLKIANRPGSL